MLVTRDRDILRVYNAGFLEIRHEFNARFVSIIPEEDACDACLRIEGDYACEATPQLPVRGCTSPGGCECWYLALPQRLLKHRAAPIPH